MVPKITLGFALAGFLVAQRGDASRPYTVEVDGRPVSFSTIGPVVVSGRVLVPLRGVLERTGATVRWSEETKTVFATRGDVRLEMTLGNATARVNGRPVPMEVPPMMMRGTVMVPLRFVVETLRASVQESDGKIRIATRPAPAPTKPASGAVPVATRETPKPQPISQMPSRLSAPPTQPSPTPVSARQTVEGTVEEVDAGATPPRITLLANGDRVSLELAPNAVVLCREGGETGTAREGRLSEVYPGDSVRVKLNATGKITILVVEYERVEGTVAAVAEDSLQLEGGTVTLARGVRVVRPDGTITGREELRVGAKVQARLHARTREATVVFITKAAPAAAPIAEAPAKPSESPAPSASGGPAAVAEVPRGTSPAGTPAAPITPSALPEKEHVPREPGVSTPTTTAPEGATRPLMVTSFTHDATTPLRAGAVLTVTLQGEPGVQATFDVGTLATGLAMQEASPGKYVGTYTVPEGLNERVSIFGRLTGKNSQSPLVQAGVPIVIDSVAPTVNEVAPAKGSTVADAHPVIYAVFEDPKGSGIDPSQVRLNVAGEDVTGNATLSPRFVLYRPTLPIANGLVTVKLSLQDVAGNRSETEWQFTVNAPEVPIRSVSHNATRPLDVGHSVTVTVAGKPRGAASFDIGTMKKGIPMSEVSPGIYQGRYAAEKGDVALSARIVAHLITESGERFSRECSEPITIITVPPKAPSITSPADGDMVTSPLILRGRAQPGVMVRVQVVRTVRKLGLWSDRDVVAACEVAVDQDGVFATDKMELPTRGREEKVTIQAVAVDPAGHRSDVVSINVIVQ